MVYKQKTLIPNPDLCGMQRRRQV